MLLPLLGAAALLGGALVSEAIETTKASLRDEILGTRSWAELEALVQRKTGRLPFELISDLDTPAELMEILDEDVIQHVARLAVESGVVSPEMLGAWGLES